MKIKAIELKKNQIIGYGHDTKKIKEILYINDMVQLTLASLKNKRAKLVCMNVCPDFEFTLISTDLPSEDAVK